MSDPLRAGLIGTGMISQSSHIPAWATIDEVDVVAIADPDESARRDAIERLGAHGIPDVTAYSSHEELLTNETIDFVDVAVPAGTDKREVIRDSLEAAVHVTCQKPFVRDLEIGHELAQLADDAGKILSVNQQARYAGVFAEANRLIEDGTLGSLRTISIDSDFQFAGQDRWLRFSVHNFDLLRHWTGNEPMRVMGWHEKQTADDRYVFGTWLDFGKGLMARVWDEHSSSATIGWRFRIGGTEGVLYGNQPYSTDMAPPNVVFMPAGSNEERLTRVGETYAPAAFENYFSHFAAAVAGERSTPTTAEDNVRSLAIAVAGHNSAKSGHWEPVEEIPPEARSSSSK